MPFEEAHRLLVGGDASLDGRPSYGSYLRVPVHDFIVGPQLRMSVR